MFMFSAIGSKKCFVDTALREPNVVMTDITIGHERLTQLCVGIICPKS